MRLTTVDYWKTKDQAFAGVTAIYNALIVDGTYMRSFPVVLLIAGEMTLQEIAPGLTWI